MAVTKNVVKLDIKDVNLQKMKEYPEKLEPEMIKMIEAIENENCRRLQEYQERYLC